MKYGKALADQLDSLPEEWRQQAIEYRKLKKVINRVASELKDLGLTSEVLKELLSQPAASSSSTSSPAAGPSSPPKAASSPLPSADTLRWADQAGSGSDEEKGAEAETRIDEVLDEVEGVVGGEDDDDEPRMSEKARGKQKAVRKRRVRATYELGGTTAHPEPRIHLVFSSCSSESYSESDDGRSHRDSSDAEDDLDGPVASPANFLFKRHARKRSAGSRKSLKSPKSQIVELGSSDGDGAEGEGAAAVEEDDDESADASLAVEAGSSTGSPTDDPPSFAATEAATESSGSVAEEAELDADDGVEFEGAGPQANELLKRMYGVGRRWSEDEGEASIVELDVDEASELAAAGAAGQEGQLRPRVLERAPSQETLRASGTPLRSELLESMKVLEKEDQVKAQAKADRRIEQADQADDEGEGDAQPPRTSGRRRRRRPRQHRREVFIPLNSDTEFLTLLASALNSLAELQLAQKRQFTEAVQLLAREVSAVSSPSRPKTDLYIWREIFSLWVEAAIFESSRERDRGERSIEEVEKKLEWFVDQVAKRKLAKRMRHKESRVALEKFIALNVELLDLKKFQVANEEAARKILKKHDKRTALTASLGFPKFIASEDTTSMISTELIHTSDNGKPRPILTLPGFPSLPHVLLSTFTTTLLPIIPQLEDYECSICGDVAFKPIRLNCGHKFCVRCLVKMQKRGQDSCPQCRKAVVLRANAGNLDGELQKFLERWFPHEVKEKERNNAKEAAREELEEMGLHERKCVVM
ncbi:hypothetical protein JCM10450v2_007173 [Rhodotorula kratochvilovae]